MRALTCLLMLAQDHIAQLRAELDVPDHNNVGPDEYGQPGQIVQLVPPVRMPPQSALALARLHLCR